MDSTLQKGIAIVEALATSEQPRGVSELAQQLGLAKSNVHRMLQTLVRCGYVQREADKPRYQCTLKLFELGTLLIDRLDIRALAIPHLRRLSQQTREAVFLSIFDGGHVLYIEKIDDTHAIQAFARVGGRTPSYCSAAGKALLAYENEEALSRLLPLQAYTARTIVEMAELKRVLAEVRRNGYATNVGEWREDVCGIAAPIHGPVGKPLAAVSISGPLERLKPKVIRSMIPLVIETAHAVSASMGFRLLRPTEVVASSSRSSASS